MRRGGIRCALIAYSAAAAARRLPEPGLERWGRSNFRGRDVSLSTGRAAVLGLVAGGASSPAVVVSAGLSAAAGVYDDLRAPAVETSEDKGLRGHLHAVRAGRLSGGVVKVVVIGSAAVASAWLTPGSVPTRLTRAALIAGSANLINLFDLRPGRAGKIALIAGLTGIASTDPVVATASGAVTGSLLATLPDDLREIGLLGDLGANSLGAVVGLRLSMLAAPARIASLAVVVGLTLASERVSFSRVIDSVPALRWADQLGRT